MFVVYKHVIEMLMEGMGLVLGHSWMVVSIYEYYPVLTSHYNVL